MIVPMFSASLSFFSFFLIFVPFTLFICPKNSRVLAFVSYLA